jgi:hypothetical protein
MKLKEYFDKYHICAKHVAPDLGITETTMYKILRGNYDAKLSFIQKVEKYTFGEVKVQDWYRDFKPEKENIA